MSPTKISTMEIVHKLDSKTFRFLADCMRAGVVAAAASTSTPMSAAAPPTRPVSVMSNATIEHREDVGDLLDGDEEVIHYMRQ